MHGLLCLVLFCVSKISLKVMAGEISQSPPSVEVRSGDTVTMHCQLNEVQSLCHTVAWLRVDPVNGMIHILQASSIKQSDDQVQSSVCRTSVYNTSVQDSGNYYCIATDREHLYLGNGTTVTVQDVSTRLTPVFEIMAFASSDGHDSAVTLQCVIGGFAPSQVYMYWLIGRKKKSGQIGSFWEDNRGNFSVKTQNHIVVSAEELRTAGDCTCVVKSGELSFTKSVHYYDIQEPCYTLISTPRMSALVAVLLFFIVSLIITEYY